MPAEPLTNEELVSIFAAAWAGVAGKRASFAEGYRRRLSKEHPGAGHGGGTLAELIAEGLFEAGGHPLLAGEAGYARLVDAGLAGPDDAYASGWDRLRSVALIAYPLGAGRPAKAPK